ncbi:hypothetical protein OROMI_001831 [Orobanche minor]
MTSYPHRRREFNGWWAVWKTKARSTFNIPYEVTADSSLDDCYQEEEMPQPANVTSDEHPHDDSFWDENPPQESEEVLQFDEPNKEQEDDEDDYELRSDDDEEEYEDELEFCMEDEIDTERDY